MQSVPPASDQPSTSARVILYTSHGELDIQLWAKQAPLACRNFIGLCLQGYYDNREFYRLVPGWMIQGGVDNVTEQLTIYGQDGKQPFKDEFHQRLKFSRRGLVAMASAGKNQNRSDFFITFGDCQHLNKKHTIFGKVVGQTVFNLLAMQGLELEEEKADQGNQNSQKDTQLSDRPKNPPIIRRTKVMANPFAEQLPKKRVKIAENQQQGKNNEQQSQLQSLKLNRQNNSKLFLQRKPNQVAKQKLFKSKKRLTFDIDGEQDEQMVDTPKQVPTKKQQNQSSHSLGYTQGHNIQNPYKIKSLYDAASSDQKMPAQPALTLQELKRRKREREEQEIKKRNLQKERSRNSQLQMETIQQVQQQSSMHQPQRNTLTVKLERPTEQSQIQALHEKQSALSQLRQQQQSQLSLLKSDSLTFKSLREGSHQLQTTALLSQQLALLSTAERRRYEYLRKSQQSKKDGAITDRLEKFKERMKDLKWMNHKVKFAIDSDNAYKLSQARGDDDGGLIVDVGGRGINYEDSRAHQVDVDKLYDMIHNEQH